MNDYHDTINRITDLATIPKTLTPDGLDYLRKQIEDYMEKEQKSELVDVLPFITLKVYNDAYRMAIQDVLQILRE